MDDGCGLRRLNQYLGFLANIDFDGYIDTNAEAQREGKEACRGIRQAANRKEWKEKCKEFGKMVQELVWF
jgi:hypothetical protein